MMERAADTDRLSTDRQMSSDSEEAVSDSDSSIGEPVVKRARFDTEPDTPPPSPSSGYDELHFGIFQRAFLQAERAQDELGERDSRIKELSKQLKEANWKAEKYTNKNIKLIHENIHLKEEIAEETKYISVMKKRRCELVAESITHGPDTQIRSVNALVRRNTRRGVSEEQMRDRKRNVSRRSTRITVEEPRNLGNVLNMHLSDGDPINVFQLCRPNTLDSISVTSALTQLSAKFTRTKQANWRKYCGECSFEVLRCEVCVTVVKKVDVFDHFFTQRHIGLVRSNDAGVSLPAMQHWLRELQQAVAAAAAEEALAAMSAAAAAVTPAQQQAQQMQRCLQVLQQAIISSIVPKLS